MGLVGPSVPLINFALETRFLLIKAIFHFLYCTMNWQSKTRKELTNANALSAMLKQVKPFI